MMPTPLALKLGSTGALARARATAVAWTAAAMLAALALPLAAQAYVTYDFAFRSTDISGNAMDGAVSGSGHTFSFTSLSAANACNPTTDAGCAVIDVLLRTALPLFSASVSVTFDNSGGLATSLAQEWFGIQVPTAMGMIFMSPLGGLGCSATRCSSFDGVILPPNGPPSLPVGTYNIGTIIWDTSSWAGGTSAVMTELVSGVDGTGFVNRPTICNTLVCETVETGFINIIPEPATGVLLALGLGGLGALARRRRG